MKAKFKRGCASIMLITLSAMSIMSCGKDDKEIIKVTENKEVTSEVKEEHSEKDKNKETKMSNSDYKEIITQYYANTVNATDGMHEEILKKINQEVGSVERTNILRAIAKNYNFKGQQSEIRAINEFTFDLYNELSAKNNTQNNFYSPFSILNAVAVLNLASDGNTKTEINNTLHIENQDKFDESMGYIYKFNEFLDKYYVDIENENLLDFEINNSIWLSDTFNKNPETGEIVIENMQKLYNTDVFRAINFNEAEGASSAINKYVAIKTHDIIPKLLNPNDVKGASSVITNTVYFKSDWVTKFKENNTYDDTFTTDGGTSEYSMMHLYDEDGLARYYETDKLVGIAVPYKGNFDLILIKSKKEYNTSSFDKLSNDKKLELFDNIANADYEDFNELSIPKIKFECTYDSLSDTLKELGIHDAFELNGSANFNKLSPDLVLSKVIHKAVIDIDEQGTEAAAATALIMVDNCVLPQFEEKVMFKTDRPVVLALREQTTGIIYFIGNINKLD